MNERNENERRLRRRRKMEENKRTLTNEEVAKQVQGINQREMTKKNKEEIYKAIGVLTSAGILDCKMRGDGSGLMVMTLEVLPPFAKLPL